MRQPAAGLRSKTMACVTKVALDFLLRPATMTSRQHSVPSFQKDEENSLGNGNTSAAREGADMAVWFMRRLQYLQCEEPSLLRRSLHRHGKHSNINE